MAKVMGGEIQHSNTQSIHKHQQHFSPKRWSMDTLDISKYNRTERIFPNLIGIIAHQLWKIICHKLFNNDESKPEPKFEQKVIETELLNIIETEKFITLKKINHDEAILKNTNQDLH
ncbi:hypothetical protein ACTFIU_002016 [Dictyostelium citrinum]